MTYICSYASPLGGITVASDGTAVTGLWFDSQKYFGSTITGECVRSQVPALEQACKWLDVYFGSSIPDFLPPLSMHDTPFRMAVWQALTDIPFGRTVSYGQVASTVAQGMGLSRMSARAVGAAVGRNPISIIVPCHRVVGADGSLTGYAGGLDIKRALLQLEHSLRA